MQQTLLASTITNDPGDDAEGDYSYFVPINYNYDEETEEPAACMTDSHVPGSKVTPAIQLKHRTDIDEFNAKFMANKGIMPTPTVITTFTGRRNYLSVQSQPESPGIRIPKFKDRADTPKSNEGISTPMQMY